MISNRYLPIKFEKKSDESGNDCIIAFKHESFPIVLIKKLDNGEVVYNFFEAKDKVELLQEDWELLIKQGESLL